MLRNIQYSAFYVIYNVREIISENASWITLFEDTNVLPKLTIFSVNNQYQSDSDTRIEFTGR